MRALLLSVVIGSVTLSLGAPAVARDREARREKREQREEKREERRDERRDTLDDKGQTLSPGANKRQRRQASRIVGGVRSGQLTKAEVDALTAHEAKLRAIEASAKADGVLTDDERKALHQELAALSRELHQEKHDSDRAAPLTPSTSTPSKATATAARRLTEVRRGLNQPSLSPAERAALEAEHSALLDTLFEAADDDASNP